MADPAGSDPENQNLASVIQGLKAKTILYLAGQADGATPSEIRAGIGFPMVGVPHSPNWFYRWVLVPLLDSRALVRSDEGVYQCAQPEAPGASCEVIPTQRETPSEGTREAARAAMARFLARAHFLSAGRD